MIIEEGFDLNLIYGTDYTYINSNTSKYKDIDNLHVELEYDETIHFYHSFDLLRKFRNEEKAKVLSFPLLVNNEFLFGELSTKSIESDKELMLMERKEVLPTVMTRVKQFAVTNDLNFRVLFLENLSAYAEKIGLESCIELIMPVLNRVPNDTFAIKMKFLQIFKNLFNFFINNLPISYDQIVNLGKFLMEFFADKKDDELLRLVCENFKLVANVLHKEDLGENVLRPIISFSTEDYVEDERVKCRCLAANLFGDLAALLGQEFCEHFVLTQLSFFSDDSKSDVRIAVLRNLVKVAEQISLIFLKRVLTIYKNLSLDPIWNVRKASVKLITLLLNLYKEKSGYTAKNEIFIEIFTSFISDSNKYVRCEALEVLPVFVYNLEKSELDLKFLDFFRRTLEEYYFNIKDLKTQSDLFYSNVIFLSAYNFPCMILCYGKENWSKLKGVYSSLANDENLEVKKSLIASFLEISKILGREILENDLLTVYNSFLSHRNEVIKSLAQDTLTDVIKLMSENIREKYVKFFKVHDLYSYYHNFKTKSYDWRKKLDTILAYSKFFEFFDSKTIFGKMLPLLQRFCFDDVHQVRKKSAKVISRIFKLTLEKNYDKIKYTLTCFASSDFYRDRIVFIHLVENLLEDDKIYEECINPLLVSLSFDKVLDVRLTLARILSKNIQKNKSLCKVNNIVSICKKLALDASVSVREYFCSEAFSSMLKEIEAIRMGDQILNLNKSCYDLLIKEFPFDT